MFQKNIINQDNHQLQEFRLLWLHITNIMRQSGDMLSSTVSYLNITAYIINIISAYSLIYDIVYTLQNNINSYENVLLSAVSFLITSGLMFIFYNSPYFTAQKVINLILL